jgi:hypothetical protein
VTVLETLKNRAGLLVSGALSFVLVVVGMRRAGGEPLVQPQIDVGIVIGVVMVCLYFIISDMRGGAQR